MGINHRKLDNQGRPLKNPYETTAEAQDRIAKDIANGTCLPAAAAAEQCGTQQETASAGTALGKATGKAAHVCPTCRGFGHVITDALNGDTKPCPTCTAGWEFVAIPHDDYTDANPNYDPSKPVHQTDQWIPAAPMDADVAPTGIADKVREAKGLGNDVIIHTPAGGLNDAELRKLVQSAKEEIMRTSELDQKVLGRARNLTATEVMERKRYEEKKLRHGQNYGMQSRKADEQLKLIQQAKNEFMMHGYFSKETVKQMDIYGINLQNWKGC